MESEDRHSEALEAELIADPDQKARREAENGVRQFDSAIEQIEYWIHPFVDGNGRTTRVTSFIVLCVRLGYRVPGANTIPEQISRDKNPYYQALELADAALDKDNKIDVSVMEDLVDSLLTKQLASVIRDARSDRKQTGGSAS